MAVSGREAPDQEDDSNSFFLAKCLLRSSVILQAVYGHIRSPSTLDIVFGKETSLELAFLSGEGVLQSICEQPVFGKIKDLKVLPWNEQQRSFQRQTHGKDLLVITSDSGKMSFVTFCVELHRFLAVSHVQISRTGNIHREMGPSLAIEPRGRAVAVHAFEEKIAIFPTSIAAGTNIVEKRMLYPRESWEKGELTASWGIVWSMAFVPNSTDANINEACMLLVVLLHRKGAIQNDLITLLCDVTKRTIQSNRCSPVVSPGPLAYSLTHVPEMPGVVLLFRYGDIILLRINGTGCAGVISSALLPRISGCSGYIGNTDCEVGDEDDNCKEVVSALLELVSADVPMQQSAEETDMTGAECAQERGVDESALPLVSAWSWNFDASLKPRLIFSMDTGELFYLQLVHNLIGDLHINLSDCLYQSPPLKCLLWMKDGFIAALAEMGDGQVLHFRDGIVDRRSIIENTSPILDFSLIDYHNERQDQMFACAGAKQEGSLRVIHSGVSVEKLISTGPMYEGVTGLWTTKFCGEDVFHSFLVLSFVEETRVLSVGLSFSDVTEEVGFNSSTSTLACGCIEDGWVAQVCNYEVRVCAPTIAAHPKGLPSLLPLSKCWSPCSGARISLAAVSFRTVILAMSRPSLLVMLGFRGNSTGLQGLVLLQQCSTEVELSCISIPTDDQLPMASHQAVTGICQNSLPNGIEVGKVCVVGTHSPSVEVRSIKPDENFPVLAVGYVSLINKMGTALSGYVPTAYVPEDVRLVLHDLPYILAGLRNGMLLRFEWGPNATSANSVPPLVSISRSSDVSVIASSSSLEEYGFWSKPDIFHKKEEGTEQIAKSGPTQLHLIASRCFGVSPVSMVPLQASLRADVIALGDRPWLLQTGRHSERIACTSILFQHSTHATAVKFRECIQGVLFVAGNSLHLVQMTHSKRLNINRISLGSTLRKISYHSESKTLLVMRSEWCDRIHGFISDICCVDPVSGVPVFSHKFDHTEVPKCMLLCKIGGGHFLLVGTGLTTGKAIIPNGEPDGAKGRLILFQLLPKHSASNSNSSPVDSYDHNSYSPRAVTFVEGEGLKMIFRSHVQLSGVVLAVSSYLDRYVLAAAGNNLSCIGFSSDSFPRLKRYDSIKTRFVITSIAANLNRIIVGDCRDGILFYTYHEYDSKLRQLYCDPMKRLVADCALLDPNTAMVTDRHGNFSVLTCGKLPEDSSNPERNLISSCWYHFGEVMLSISKGSLACKIRFEDNTKSCIKGISHKYNCPDASVVAGTLLGSVVAFVRLTREQYELLDAVQCRLASYPLTAPVLGNNHAHFRGRGCPAGAYQVLDGDMLGQFLELTSSQQYAVLADQPGFESPRSLDSDFEEQLKKSFDSKFQEHSKANFSVEEVLRLLDSVQNSLT